MVKGYLLSEESVRKTAAVVRRFFPQGEDLGEVRRPRREIFKGATFESVGATRNEVLLKKTGLAQSIASSGTVVQLTDEEVSGTGFTTDLATEYSVTLDNAGDYDAHVVIQWVVPGSIGSAGYEGITVDVQDNQGGGSWYSYRDGMMADVLYHASGTGQTTRTLARSFRWRSVTAGTELRLKGWANSTALDIVASNFAEAESSWHIVRVG